MQWFDSERLARAVSLVFAFNPASIFFSAAYTESLFASLTFAGLYFLYDGRLIITTFVRYR